METDRTIGGSPANLLPAEAETLSLSNSLRPRDSPSAVAAQYVQHLPVCAVTGAFPYTPQCAHLKCRQISVMHGFRTTDAMEADRSLVSVCLSYRLRRGLSCRTPSRRPRLLYVRGGNPETVSRRHFKACMTEIYLHIDARMGGNPETVS